MTVRINGKVVQQEPKVVEKIVYVEKEVPDIVAWFIIILGGLAMYGWWSLWA